MDIFDIEPNLPGVPADCGHEPSLRELLCRYYGQGFDMEGAAKYADLYIQEIRAKANYYWEGVEMKGINRFGFGGVYVLHSDHEAEVARLRAELQNAAKAALDAVALSCEKEREADALRAEVEAYRKDAERYRWLRDQAPWSDSKNPCPYSEQEDGQLRCITAGLDDKIDAAMGASA